MLQSYKALFENGVIRFTHPIPNVRKSEVIVTFLKTIPHNRIKERLDALEKLNEFFQSLPTGKIVEFDEAISRRSLLGGRQVEL